MNKFKKILLGVASVLTLGALFVVTGAKVSAETIKYSVVAYTVTGETSTSNIIATGNRAKTTRVNPNDENNTDNVVFSVGSSNTWGTDKGLSNGINVSSSTNTSSRFYKVAIPSGYYVSSFVVSCDAKTNVRALNLSSDGSSTALANTETPSTTKSTTTSLQFITTGKRLNYVDDGGDIYIYCGGSVCVYSVTLTLEVDVAGENAVTATFDENGGSSVDNVILDEPGKFNLPAGPTYAGYIFNGWKTGNTTYDAGDEYDLQEDTTFVAQWTKDPSLWFDVAYDTDGGNEIASLTEQPTGTKITLPLAVKANYNFDYWTANSGTDKLYAGTEYTLTANVEFHAHYCAKLYPEQTSANYILNPANLSTGDITSDTTSGIFTLLASSEKKFTVDANSKTIDREEGTLSLTQRIKFNGTSTCTSDSKGRVIQIDAPKAGKIKFLALQSNDTKTAYVKVLNSTYGTVDSKKACVSTNYYLQEIELSSAGTYYLIADTNACNVHYLEYVANKMSKNTTASVFAEKNTAGDTLRFVGTLTGITDLDNIQSVELVLKKGGVASKKQIFLTTCYTSVTGTSQTCAQADNTYYVIYRLKGIKDVTGSFTKQLVITFTDGSTTSSEVTDFSL